jgi:hypothetical protein
MVRLAADFDLLQARGLTVAEAMDELKDKYQASLLRCLWECCLAEREGGDLHNLPVHALRLGMVLAVDIYDNAGVIVAPKGYEVTTQLLYRLQNAQVSSVLVHVAAGN